MSTHQKHVNRFVSNFDGLSHFYSGDNQSQKLRLLKDPESIKSVHSSVYLLPYLMSIGKQREYINVHGKHHLKVLGAKTPLLMKKHMLEANEMSGGSFFSRLGHAFKKVGHAVAHGVTSVAKKVASVAKKGAQTIGRGAKTAYDYEKHHYRGQLSSALPYIEKYAINPLVESGATALGSLVGNPELGEATAVGLQVGEKALNPYLQKKIRGNQSTF